MAVVGQIDLIQQAALSSYDQVNSKVIYHSGLEHLCWGHLLSAAARLLGARQWVGESL